MASKKLYYVFGVDTQDFVLEQNDEMKIWNTIEELQLKQYLIEKEKPKKKYKKIDGIKTLDNAKEISDWKYEHKEELATIKKELDVLKEDFRLAIEKNADIKRELRFDRIKKRKANVVSDGKKVTIADSTLTRTLGLSKNRFNPEVCIIRVYYTGIMESLIKNGFTYDGHDYCFFTASAGQTKSKKFVCIREDLKNKHWNKLAAGLSVKDLNASGGFNTAKFLAYVALCSSKTTKWDSFDIDKAIVVDDLQVDVTGEVDFIDYETYEITHGVKTLPVEQNDGSGMMLPRVSDKNFMVRMPWFKGLLGVFDFRKFIEVNNCSPVVKDVWGDEHNVIDEDIEIIFTKSQFKLWKLYPDWESYKDKFKKYDCEACITNMEDDEFDNVKNINYQMIQTLRCLTDEDIIELSKRNVDEILSLGTSKERKSVDKNYILKIFGATKDNKNKSPFQKCLLEYPEMLQDKYIKEQLKSKKESLVKELYAGKFLIEGDYTFALPDLYAFCEHLFMGIDNPQGLLKAGEVCCRLYPDGIELDCLRSPHLYCEHVVETNNIQEWFTTNAIYTNAHDFLSRIVALDWDGDHLLVCSNPTIIKAAKKVISKLNICPLYYDMKKADNTPITNESLFNCMQMAFNSKSIGYYSNAITKIWNIDRGDDWSLSDEQIKIIKLLVMENNFQIDYFKTMFMPTRPEHINALINKYLNIKVPRFFEYAKGYEPDATSYPTDTPVNNIAKIISLPIIRYGKFNDLDIFDYRMFLSKNMTERRFKGEIVNVYKRIINSTRFDKKLDDCVKDYGLVINNARNTLYRECKQLGVSDWHDIVDIIVEEIFHRRPTGSKAMFWEMFGSIMYQHLMSDFDDEIDISYCIDCGEEIVRTKGSKTCRCPECQNEYTLISDRNSKRNNYKAEKKILVCEECGVVEEVPMSTQRCLCEDCYKEYRKDVINIASKKSKGYFQTALSRI